MIQPARVLPSNAPPLNSDGDLTPRAFQEPSSNRQHGNGCLYTAPLDRRYPFPLSTENNYSERRPAQEAPQTYRQAPQQRHNYRYPKLGPCGYQYDQARNEKIARYLNQRFRACDQFVKYRERQCKEAKNDEQKWPEHLEWAFFQALVQWPPMGRRKLAHKDKQRGRNELICDFIEELTGESRTRKQVSSHIQVLRPFVNHDPFIMKYLTDPLKDEHHGRRSLYSDVRRSSHRSAAGVAQLPGAPASALSLTAAYNISKVKDSLDVFAPTDFSMFVQRKHHNNVVEHTERLHTYTSSIIEPLQPEQQFSSWQSLQHEFPLLFALHQRRPIDCNLLWAEASLAFPDKTFKDEHGVALPGIELGISLLCNSFHLPVSAVVKCHNTFYKDCHLLDATCADLRLSQSEDESSVETQLKFGSTFWAGTLASIAQKLNKYTEQAKAREEVAHYVKGITAVQEIFVLTEYKPERLLIIYWTFRLSNAKQGMAYWTRMKLPTSILNMDNKDERVDSVYDYSLGFTDASTQQVTTPQPTLQSPFEYDNGSNSATTSATVGQISLDGSTHNGLDWTSGASFDFNIANHDMNMPFHPDLDFSTFDSSAINFDTAADFETDPALQDYSQIFPADYAHQQGHVDSLWGEAYQAVLGTSTTANVVTPGYPLLAAELSTSPERQFDAHMQREQGNSIARREQANGGAGQEILWVEDPSKAFAQLRTTQNGWDNGIPATNTCGGAAISRGE